jgi:hypothetical protein
MDEVKSPICGSCELGWESTILGALDGFAHWLLLFYAFVRLRVPF